MLVFINYCINS